jgi:hypothetical protein
VLRSVAEQPFALLASFGEPVFALVDGARDVRIAELVRASGLPWRSLYEGRSAKSLANSGPFLVDVGAELERAAVLLERGWGNAWGVWGTSTAGFAVLRAHFRRFLMVRDAGDRALYFRFYDPRVLAAFLPLASPEQNAALFAQVTRFVVEDDEDPSLSCVFFHERDRPGMYVGSLRIDEAQMKALGEHTDRQFVKRAAAFVGEHLPNTGSELRPAVRAAVRRARGFGLWSEQHVMVYVITAATLGWNFDRRHQDARAVLASRDLKASWKAEWLTRWARRAAEAARG